MRYTSLLLYVSFVLFTGGCSQVSPKNVDVDEETGHKGYQNGTHCADVEYFNPNTGTRNKYILQVEVSDNKVVKILFGNGGWLDDSHMTPPKLDEDGKCRITSDKGYIYDIQLTGKTCFFTHTIEPEKWPLILASCATSFGMTNGELLEYEKRFEVERTKVISEEMCEKIQTYIASLRKQNELLEAMENGYIQSTYLRKTGDFITCNFVIVKRRNHYYLMLVNDAEKCAMGLMQFDPENKDWQEVVIQVDPQNAEVKMFRVRIFSDGSDLNSMKSLITQYCE